MGKYMIIKRKDYERMQDSLNRMMQINESFIENIRKSKVEILTKLGDLKHSNNVVLDKLHMTETARRSNASKIGGLTTSLNKEKNKTKELLNTVNDLEDNVKDLEVKLEESMSDKYLVRKLPAGRRPKTQTMKLKSCTVQSNIARKMFGDNK